MLLVDGYVNVIVEAIFKAEGNVYAYIGHHEFKGTRKFQVRDSFEIEIPVKFSLEVDADKDISDEELKYLVKEELEILGPYVEFDWRPSSEFFEWSAHIGKVVINSREVLG